MKIVKKIIVLLLTLSSISNVFAQENDEYQKHLAKAKEYENQKKWCYALDSYYNAIISNELPENKQEAVEKYNILESSIKNGNPGLDQYNQFTIHDEWKKLLIEAEQFGSNFNPYEITVKNFSQDSLNYNTKTATYKAEINFTVGERYKHTIETIQKGYEKAYVSDWSDMPTWWPYYSASYEKNEKYDINGAKVFDANSKNLFRGQSNYLNAFSMVRFDSFDVKIETGLFVYEFNIVNETGKELVKPTRCLLNDYGSVIYFSGITPDIMDEIENNKAFINLIACYLKYGKYNPGESREKKNFINDLSEVQLPIETSVLTYLNNKNDMSIDRFTAAINYKENMKTIKLLDELNVLNDTDMVPIDELKILMLKTEVTQDVYEIITGGNPSDVKGSKNPVEKIYLWDAIYFCNKASKLRGLEPVYLVDGESDLDKWSFLNHGPIYSEKILEESLTQNLKANGYRLPTYEEWVFASNKDKYSWCVGGRDLPPHPVAQKKANKYGLFDMKGNVSEIVSYEDTFFACGEYTSGRNTNNYCEKHKFFPSSYTGFRIVRNFSN